MSKKTLTVEQIEKMSYQQMIKACPELGVKYTYQKKDPLKAILIDTITNGVQPEHSIEINSDQSQYGEEITEILDHPQFNKSDKMRELYDAGITKPAEIAKMVDAHYSFVYTVLSKYKKTAL